MDSASSLALLLPPAEAAQLLNASKCTLLKWHNGERPAPPGFPPPVKFGDLLRWRRSDIEKYVEDMHPASTSAIPPLPAPAALAAVPAVPAEPTAPRRGRGRPRKLGGAK